MTGVQGFISGIPTAGCIDLNIAYNRATKFATSPATKTDENGFIKLRGPHKFGAIGDGIPPPSKIGNNDKEMHVMPRAALQDMDSNSNGARTSLATYKPLQLTHGRRLGPLMDDTWQHPIMSNIMNGLDRGEVLRDHKPIDVLRLNQAIPRTVAIDDNVAPHARLIKGLTTNNSCPLDFKNSTQPWNHEYAGRDQRLSVSGSDELKTIITPWLACAEEPVQCSDLIHKCRGEGPILAGNGNIPFENLLGKFPRYDKDSKAICPPSALQDNTFAQYKLLSTSASGRHQPSGTSIPEVTAYHVDSAAQNPLGHKYDDAHGLITRIDQLNLQDRDIGSSLTFDYLDFPLHEPPTHSPLISSAGTHNAGVDPSILQPQELDRDTIHCSPNYKGNPRLTGNQSASISHKDSCSLWITNLNFPVAENAYRDLLSAARGCGKVYACVINPPDTNKGHTTYAAKLVFFDKSGAHALLRRSATGEFVVNGYIPKVIYNRIRTASQPPGPESRVIHIDGPKRVVEKNVLMQFFTQRFNFQTDEVIVLSEDPGPDGRRRLEWRFGSYRCQAATAMSTIQKQRGLLPPGVDGNFWGQVVTFYGVDPCAAQQ